MIKSTYRNEIDGLRALAVIAVIINHFNKDVLPSGYLGVDIFFVISGYVITSSLKGREHKNFGNFIKSFYARRIKRLIPALTVFVIITSILICIFNPVPIFHLRTAIASLFGVSNIFIFKTSQGYFTPSSSLNPFTHTWSLSVEEQFYFLFPLLAWFTGYTRNKKNSSKYLFLSVFIFASISLGIFLFFYSRNQNAAYFLMPSRFWEMATGSLTFIGISQGLKFFKFARKLSSYIVLIALICIMFLPLSLAVWSTITVVLLTMLLIISVEEGGLTYQILTKRIFLNIGLMSYSLYLWHWGVISISHWTFGVYWWTIPFQIILILSLSIGSFKYIEKPFRSYEYGTESSSIKKGLLMILGGQFILFFLGISGKRLLYSGNLLGIYNRDISSRTIFYNRCNLSRRDFDMIIKDSRCSSSEGLYNKKRIIIAGDSHANMFSNAFSSLASKDYELNIFTGNGCSFPPLKDKSIKQTKRCYEQMQKASLWIQSNVKEGDIIFIGNSQINSRLINLFDSNKYQTKDLINEKYLNHLNLYSKNILNRGALVHFLIGGPSFNGVTDSYCAIEWFRPVWARRKECILDKRDYEKNRSYVIKAFLDRNTKVGGLNLIFNYLDLICDQSKCYAGGYMDSNHFTDDLAFTILLKSDLGKKISGKHQDSVSHQNNY